MSGAWPYLAAILPTILVAILFYYLIRSMIEGDRRERLAQSQYDAELRRRNDEPAGGAPIDGEQPGEEPGRPEGNPS